MTSGLYEKYGLDAKLVFIQGGSVLLQAMVAGQAQASQNGVAETATAILRGGDVRMLGVTAKIFPYSLIAAKNIKSAKDLVGGRVAINRSRGRQRVWLQCWRCGNSGSNPEKDVTMLQVGGSRRNGWPPCNRGACRRRRWTLCRGCGWRSLGFRCWFSSILTILILGPVVSGKFLRESPALAEAFIKATSKESPVSNAIAKRASKRSPAI